jgi:uracil-DNA glycosylase
VNGDDPRLAARRWLALYRDLGVEEIDVARRARLRPAPEPASALPAGPDPARGTTSAPQVPAPGPAGPGERKPESDAGRIGRLIWMDDAEEALLCLRGDVVGDCRRCRLSEQRTKIVFGVGHARARLMFVGEGPGADEDRQGEPFVGRAGQLLDRIIIAMGLARADVYIANIVKCRPPENRTPLPDEAATCITFLQAQVRIIQPEVIVALGKTAATGLTGVAIDSITRERGRWLEYEGIPVKVTFHPAYLLRNPAAKRPVWEDMQDVMTRLGLGGR